MSEAAVVTLRGLPEAVRLTTFGDTLRVRLYARQYNGGSLPDPGAVTPKIKLRKPEGAVIELSGSDLTRERSEWFADVILDKAGAWQFRAELTGAFTGADEAQVVVPESMLT